MVNLQIEVINRKAPLGSIDTGDPIVWCIY